MDPSQDWRRHGCGNSVGGMKLNRRAFANVDCNSNYGEDKAKGEKEKRAVWLTLEVLEQMLKWIKYPGLSQSVQLMFRDQKIPTPSNYFLCAPKMPSNPPRQWYTVFSARGTSDTSDTKFTFIPIEAPPYQKSTDTGYQGRHIYIIRPQGTSFLLASKGDGLAFTSHKHTNEQAWFVLEKYGEVHEIYEILKKGGWNEENYLNLNIDCGEIRTRRPEELQCRHLNRLIPNVKLMKPKSVSGGTKPDVRFEIK